MTFSELLHADDVDIHAIAKHLDGMPHDERVHATRTLPRSDFPRLFAAAEKRRDFGPEDMVPASAPPHEVTRHIGVNSLAMSRLFEKPMYRTDEGAIGGRNVQTFEWATGPGYFSIVPGRAEGEILLNYSVLPDSKPNGWPSVKSNARGLSYVVFRDLNDYVRRVSNHVVIGEAWRHGKNLGQYFILVRQV